MAAKLENSAMATELEKSVFIPIPKKGNVKECSNYHMIALISHANKVMLKILQAIKKARESSRKTFTSALSPTPKPLTVWITTNCGKFFKRWKLKDAYSLE